MTSWASGDHGRLKPELSDMNLLPPDQRGVLDLPGAYQFPLPWLIGFCDKLCKPQPFSILMNKLACGGGIDDDLG